MNYSRILSWFRKAIVRTFMFRGKNSIPTLWGLAYPLPYSEVPASPFLCQDGPTVAGDFLKGVLTKIARVVRT